MVSAGTHSLEVKTDSSLIRTHHTANVVLTVPKPAALYSFPIAAILLLLQRRRLNAIQIASGK